MFASRVFTLSGEAPALASHCGDVTDWLAHSTGMRNGVPAHEICACARAVERFAAAQR